MKLEQQVTSLEISKRLKELGVKQESLYKYCAGHTMYTDNDDGVTEKCPNTDLLEDDEYCPTAGLTCEFTYSAFTVAELGEMIGSKCESRKIGNEAMIADGQKYVVYFEPGNGSYHKIYSDTEADARAKMLIYLLENNLIKN